METAAEGAESEAKTVEDITDANGKITVPPTNIDCTDINGTAQVIEGENSYNIVVEDTKVKIENAYVEIKDGKISFLLPDEHTLTTDNQTTVTVTDKDSKPVSGISVTIKDKTTEKTAATNSSGKVTLPVKTSGGGVLSDAGGVGRSTLELPAVRDDEKQERREPCSADYQAGKSDKRHGGAQGRAESGNAGTA